ncbi:CPBP family intramembrane glutamic endopeptidase [Halioxenophilus aromaticivorans]|uniref:CAAX prenyl protease 2/Lysostaphin resistance protein A-like domain-containing protein n=1 Tax=Halioxenophilus aromaticivorans TaxID=1306992 RepID=A0AAV3U9C9_9ALTE
MTDNQLLPLQGRYVVLIWLLPWFYLPGLELLDELIWQAGGADYWFDVLYYYLYAALVVLLLGLLVVWHKLPLQVFFSPPTAGQFPQALALTGFSFFFSMAAAYALFYPLSFVVPEFVNYWYINLPPLIIHDQGSYPLLANLLSVISLAVIAPVTEEFAFRGLLLHRWGHKYGVLPAILWSSFFFGIAHPDPIGAAFFGAAMCLLYLQTKTLWVPIICHALNNLVVWLISVGYEIWLGPEYYYTLEDFQKEWVWGLGAGVICVVWAGVRIMRPGKKFTLVLELPGQSLDGNSHTPPAEQ